MPVEMGMWRMDGARPRRLAASPLPTEAALEDFLEADPSLLGDRLLVIGRQVRTPHGHYIDLLAMDAEGNLRVLELKRERTPRDVVAQILDYGSWVSDLDRDTIIEIANDRLPVPFETAFADVFGSPPPDELNTELQLTIVATDLDASSERIVTYLRTFGVPINAVFFSHVEDEGRRYLARSWLVAGDVPVTGGAGKKRSKRAEWNGRDWFVSFGDSDVRAWEDARRYNFVSAGGDPWYSRTLRALPVGARVFVHIPKRGYVGVGITTGEAQRFDVAEVDADSRSVRLADQPLRATYRHVGADEAVTDDNAEYVVPVRWSTTAPKEDAFWTKGMFANQNSACKLRQEFTLEGLVSHFGLAEDGGD
ncbi:endonuclease NucS domain-containing protein [Georgenia wangjunii]|uniref:endonuclease NucS domain-containing protein n=1 Tax=Georgenia wangjunii TaxID=3117730 RepID=UPI002F26B4FF